jgi:hypothetical protein
LAVGFDPRWWDDGWVRLRVLVGMVALSGCGRFGFDAHAGDNPMVDGSIDGTSDPDASSAAVSILAPPAGADVGPTATLSGSCDTDQPLALSGGGLASPSSTGCAVNAYSVTITFTAGTGTKEIVITQTDRSGQVSSVTRTFVRTAPPMIAYRSSANDYRVTQGLQVPCTLTINKPAGVVDGDLLIGTIYTDGAGGSITTTGWTRLNLSNPTNASFYKLASGEPASYGFAIDPGGVGGTCESGGVIAAFTGVRASGPIGPQSANTMLSTNLTALGVSGSAASMLVVTYGANGPASGISAPAGLTIDATSHVASPGDWGSALIGWKLVPAGPTGDQIATISPQRDAAAAQVLLITGP